MLNLYWNSQKVLCSKTKNMKPNFVIESMIMFIEPPLILHNNNFSHSLNYSHA